MSLERPPNLPNLDIIRDVIRDPTTTGLNTSKISFMMGGNDWSPSFMTGQQPISISRVRKIWIGFVNDKVFMIL
jgi:hypothetical protein